MNCFVASTASVSAPYFANLLCPSEVGDFYRVDFIMTSNHITETTLTTKHIYLTHIFNAL